VESRKIDGRACELRMFVIADPSANAIRAIPGMVCPKQVPFGERAGLDAHVAASLKSVAVSGPRTAAIGSGRAHRTGPGRKKLEQLGRFAVLQWSRNTGVDGNVR
jgi:hypothetical protein